MERVGKATTSIIQPKAHSAKVSKDTKKAVSYSSLEKLNGLNTLANQKMSYVKKVNAISDEDLRLIALVKEELGIFLDEFPCDNIMAFIIRSFLDSENSSDMVALAQVIVKFNEMDKEQANKIINSKFMFLLMNSKSNNSFKFACLDISKERLDSFEPLVKNPLTKAYSESYFFKRKGNYLYTEEIFDKFEKAVKDIEDFAKLKNSSIFYDLLTKRNSDDISELVKILKDKITTDDDKEINELHSLLKTLLEAKTPEGKFIFGSSKVSDKTSKTMLSGIENILNSRKNNPKQFETLMNLLYLTKQGKIPLSVLAILAKDGKINPDFILAVEKMQKGENSIVQYSDRIKALLEAKSGEVVQIENELFYKDRVRLSKIDLEVETFNKLFPKVETMALSQGQLGDCYLVGAIYDFMKNPHGRKEIFQMFSQDKDDIIVTIPDAKEFPIRFSNKVFLKDGEKNINAPLGIQMLEEAYKQTRALKYSTSSKMTSIEGGDQMRVYNAFLGKKDAKSYFYSVKTKESKTSCPDEIEYDVEKIGKEIEDLKSIVKNLKDSDSYWAHMDYLLDRETIERINRLEALQRCLYEYDEQEDNYEILNNNDEMLDRLLKLSNSPFCNYIISLGTKRGDDWFDKSKLIDSAHAYSIKSVDKKAKTIDVVNPWNTAQYVTITFDEFKKYFNMMNVCEV